VSGQLHALAALPSGGKCPRYPLDSRLGGPQSRSGRCGEEKILDPTGTRTPTPRSFSRYPVAILTTLSRSWVDNIKIDLREIGWDDMDWIDLAQDTDQCRALVNTVISLRVP
jgi:hypothetical protein